LRARSRYRPAFGEDGHSEPQRARAGGCSRVAGRASKMSPSVTRGFGEEVRGSPRDRLLPWNRLRRMRILCPWPARNNDRVVLKGSHPSETFVPGGAAIVRVTRGRRSGRRWFAFDARSASKGGVGTKGRAAVLLGPKNRRRNPRSPVAGAAEDCRGREESWYSRWASRSWPSQKQAG